ncbi:putative F-box domain-containing protein [Helianthus annuus]|uniref:F-box domain-containing protein n=1 Tax=Helianthus annuus TaxID=4232 RepID=A0A251VS49_HELAN|nr:F-box/kelch-repeat protein At3g23880-like [Helianthus annuus]KAF5823755.1 putative F-box domain-containing protein [Helianthus annuus]KAJ0624748.1 putative F-box domain-containing protein [Helianthus annuus]KAJ0628436.1 putative F-box domain-containing protein [Helianthus annuus]KAJ0784715.1 putative F-box domain-containing protein [Helianthus annuus]KAJ0793981.1 putative F-box domain-containing protein [Helianthus annuus]
MSDHIPFDIQVEIIKRLPIRSLIRVRSVSKVWKSVIESSDFIVDYTVHNHDQPQHLLIRYDNLYSEETYVSIVDDDTFPQNKVSIIVPPSVNLLWDSFVVGASHGLVCLFGYYRNHDDAEYYSGTAMAVLWNPSIRKSVAIAVPDVDWPAGTNFGFGVCPATSDPKIVKITDTHTHKRMKGVSCSRHWLVEVFSLSSRVWRSSVGNLSDNLFEIKWPHSQVIIDGSVYWFGTKISTSDTKFELFISFDLSTEEFREIYLPNTLAFHDPMYMYLFKLCDSLIVLQEWSMNGIYKVWMMDNGDSKSFTNLCNVNIPNLSSCPLEFRRNGELMMRLTDDSDALIVYNPFLEHMNDLGIEGQCYSSLVSSYTESLILLDQADTLVDDEDDEETIV